MTNVQSKHKWGDYETTNTWIRTDSLDNLTPVTQVYGICFNDKNEILVCREGKDGPWQIPGGHPENDETIEETLSREMLEEVDVKVKNIKLLGVQKVDFPNNPTKSQGDIFYQVRCICEVDELLPQTPDPDSGKTWERKFVSAEEVTEYVKWQETGDAMFKDAIQLHMQIKNR